MYGLRFFFIFELPLRLLTSNYYYYYYYVNKNNNNKQENKNYSDEFNT